MAALRDPGHRFVRLCEREGAQRQRQPTVCEAREQLGRRSARLGFAAQQGRSRAGRLIRARLHRARTFPLAKRRGRT